MSYAMAHVRAQAAQRWADSHAGSAEHERLAEMHDHAASLARAAGAVRGAAEHAHAAEMARGQASMWKGAEKANTQTYGVTGKGVHSGIVLARAKAESYRAKAASALAKGKTGQAAKLVDISNRAAGVAKEGESTFGSGEWDEDKHPRDAQGQFA